MLKKHRKTIEALAFLLQIWTEIEAENNMAEPSEARQKLSNFIPNRTEIEVKIKHIAERSEAEALTFLLHIWTDYGAWSENRAHGRAKRGRSSRIFAANFADNEQWSQNKARGRAKRGRSSRLFAANFKFSTEIEAKIIALQR